MITGFVKNCINNPYSRAIVINDESYNYSELYNIALHIQIKLNELNNTDKTDHLIGIYTDHSVNCYASILGILLNENGFVPLNRKFPNERIAEIIRLSGIKKILCRSFEKKKIEEIISLFNDTKSFEIIITDFEEINTTLPTKNQPFEVSEEKINYLLFTSGSTGDPKGISITNKNFRALLDAMTLYNHYDFNSTDSFLQMFELSFDVSIACMFIAWEVGACVIPVSTDNFVFIETVEIINKYQISVVTMAPSAIAYMKQLKILEEFDFSFIRYTFLTGEALVNSLVESWSSVASNSIIVNAYGPTETTVWSFMYKWNKDQVKKEIVNGLVPIGIPLEGIKYKIVDEYLVEVTTSKPGELLIYGNQVANGYWNDLTRTKESFSTLSNSTSDKKWYRTGDIVIKNELKNIVYLNRGDNQVQINGFRVELGEIEYRIREYTKNDLVAVIAIKSENETLSLVAFIEKLKIEVTFLKDRLLEVLPSYMIPKKIYSIESMPLNNNGKIDKKKLKELIDG